MLLKKESKRIAESEAPEATFGKYASIIRFFLITGAAMVTQPLQLRRQCTRMRSLRRTVGSRVTDSKDNSPGGTTGTPTPDRIVKLLKH